MVRNEAERQFYLAAAGIRMWYARESLPGAAPSPDFDFGAENESNSGADVELPPIAYRADPVSGERGRERIAELQSLMGGKSEATQQPDRSRQNQREPINDPLERVSPAGDSHVVSTDSVQPVEPSDVPLQELVQRVCVTAWMGPRITLLCDIAEDASFALQENLARNILRSIGEADVSQCNVVRWPLFNNLNVTLNSEDDLADVLASSFTGDKSTQKLITLGLACEPWPQLIVRSLGRVPDIVFSGTLASLASDPSQKRRLWQAIRFLAPDR